MNETDFISSIDCCFPYDKPLKWKRISAMAPRISSNAAFMVIHEICRTSSSTPMSRRNSEKLLQHLFTRFRHPAVKLIAPAIRSYLHRRKLRPGKAAALMRKLCNRKDEYNALAICYFSAHDNLSRTLEHTNQLVVSKWEASRVEHNEA